MDLFTDKEEGVEGDEEEEGKESQIMFAKKTKIIFNTIVMCLGMELWLVYSQL